ncbi:ARM repeat-containing protein [Gigaspora margarita]|uniref:non-specific serine/threonine protein kinase n=1 Tax=Gigaspora margarita TaxID=4874 RepID=A0A8H4A6E5_GIGMA|nr:ARM repeat-containing protein [Gigaspora margarita]
MGNNISSTTTSIATAGIDSYVSELRDIEYERSLSSARFMKTIRGRHKEGLVVIKIFIKPEPGLSLENVVKTLREEKAALSEVPNAFPYQRIIETEKAGYLIRQYFFSSLYDRISTRPFLNCIEKKWITYQILCGVHDAHTRGIYHGDIKTENILVTSWNWVYLADFAGYKPTYLPEDNPADFSFFFDTSSRRTCYIAPERFYKPGSEIDRRKNDLEFGEKDGAITPAMDIFSLGCVIAELFLEGTPIFSLAQLFKYRTGEYDPCVDLEKIEDSDIRALVKHMIHVDPSQRYTAEQYLQEWRGTAFPQYFYTFLHQYIGSVTDPHNQTHSRTLNTNGTSKTVEPQDSNITTSTIVNTDADEKIERIYYEFDKIAFFLGFYNENAQDTEIVVNNSHSDKVGESSRPIEVSSPNATPALTVDLHIPNYDYFALKNKKRKKNADDGALIFLSLICATIRNTAYPSSKLHALDMLLAIGQHLEDEFKLDRLVPYLIALLGDEVGLVRANTVKTLAHLLSMVDTITPSNATIFPEYIMPNLRKFATDPEILVRITYAQCIAIFAETALRFLELTQQFKADDYLNVTDNDAEIEGSYEATYDATLHDLQSIIQEQVTTLLIDTESAVKRALLSNITSLCIFFGRQKANDVLLSHMITYLNDRDWMLRSAFFESIVGVGTFVGGRSLEEYILPLMIQSLSDAEEFVVEKVLNSLTSLAELGLFQKMKLWELIAIVSPLMCHPGIYIRYGTIAFVASAAKLLPTTDVWCIVYPIIRPFLQAEIAEVTELNLLENVKEPIPRPVFDKAVSWAGKFNKSLFWKQAKERKANKSASTTFSGNSSVTNLLSRRNSTLAINAGKISKSEEDEHNLETMRSMGMTYEDEEKIIAMRDYIYKLSVSKMNTRPRLDENLKMESIVLKNLGITPHNVFVMPTNSDGHTIRNPLLPDKTNVVGTPGLYRIKSAKSSNVSLAEQTVSRVSSDSNLQLLKAEEQARLISTSLREARINADGKFPAKPVSVPLQSEFASSSTNSRKNLPNPILINAAYMSSQDSLVPSLSTPLRERHISLVKKPIESPKAAPATSTNTTTVVGTMEIPIPAASKSDVSLNSINGTASPQVEEVPTRKNLGAFVSSTYEGNDRNVKNLLDSLYLEAFPEPMPEFGPKVTKSLVPRPGKAAKGTPVLKTIANWRPEGTLVAHMTEHKLSINQICVAPDHNFFASCSDDGTVKIWDCARFVKNFNSRARVTYNQQGGKIKCMTFIDSTHCIAAASDNGSIHIFRVDYSAAVPAPKYGKLQNVKETYLSGEYAVAMEHYDTGTESILLYATSKGSICGLDLRTMQVMWKFENPKSHGVITAMVSDKKHRWLLIGTSRGIFTLWDLRFRIQIRSWVHPTKSRISRLLLHPQIGNQKWWVIVAAGKNEISIWDIEKVECKEVFGVRADEKIGGVSLDMFKAVEPPGPNDILRSAFTAHESSFSADNSIRAVLYPHECSYMITAGSDRKIRFWDNNRIEDSYVIVGSDADEVRPTYNTRPFDGIKVHYELLSSTTSSSQNSTHSNGHNNSNHSNSSTKRPSANNKSYNNGKNQLISYQQLLLKNHLDCITDLAITEIPHPMLISGDRDGVIKVFL